jgi:hypothetical protein
MGCTGRRHSECTVYTCVLVLLALAVLCSATACVSFTSLPSPPPPPQVPPSQRLPERVWIASEDSARTGGRAAAVQGLLLHALHRDG